MPKYFMYGTPIAETEREMMRAPNFSRRGRGMTAMNKFDFHRENPDCRHLAGSKKYAIPDSVTFNQDSEKADISHIELIRSCFAGIRDIAFKYRIERLREFEQVRTIDRCRLLHYIGHLNVQAMWAVDQALAVSFGLGTAYVQEQQICHSM